jgi:hypothetical protein
MMTGDELDAAAICRAWSALLLRGAALLPFFAENLLSVSASGVARELGFRRADALGRYLLANRLPPFMLFRNGIYVVQLLEIHESGVRLSQWASTRGHYASGYSHFVHKVTGATWTDVVAQGSVQRKAIELRSWASHIGEVDG